MLKLKRGLGVVLGDIGTGKTTLARKLCRILKSQPDTVSALILNPVYKTEKQLLEDLAEHFHIGEYLNGRKRPTNIDYIKAMEKFLFKKAAEEGKTVVVFVDECQKMSERCFEVFRTLLNYETNEYKMIQLVFTGQLELLEKLASVKNLWDRIAMKHMLNPVSENEVANLIQYRLEKAGHDNNSPLFSREAVARIYRHTKGYPRKITTICHDALQYIVMNDMDVVEEKVIEKLIDNDTIFSSRRA